MLLLKTQISSMFVQPSQTPNKRVVQSSCQDGQGVPKQVYHGQLELPVAEAGLFCWPQRELRDPSSPAKLDAEDCMV